MKNYRFNQSRFDQFFKEKLSSVKTNPSFDAWERLQMQLEPNNKAKSSKWILSVAAVITLLFAVALVFQMRNGLSVSENSQVNAESNSPSLNFKTPVEESLTLVETNISEIETANDIASTSKIRKSFNASGPEEAEEYFEEISTTTPDISDHVLLKITKSRAHTKTNIAKSAPAIFRLPTYDLPESDISTFKRAIDYAMKVRNGDEPLFDIDLVKVKKDLFAFAKNVKVKSETHN